MSAFAAEKPPEKPEQTLRESEKKWGKAAIKAGFSVIPNMLFIKQHALGLDCIDLVIILQIAKHWWRQDEAPYPSQVQLAKTMNVDLATVKRHLARLRRDGFLDWKGRKNDSGGQASNAYDLSGLVAKVENFAREELEARTSEHDERKARRQRKKARSTGPSLHVVAEDSGRE